MNAKSMNRARRSPPATDRASSVLLACLAVAGALLAGAAQATETAAEADTTNSAGTTTPADTTSYELIPRVNTIFGPGEKMVFDITYGVVTAGEGILEVLGVKTYQGHEVYHIQSKANSNRFFSSVYKVRDKVVSYIDTTYLFSRYFYKRLREGDYKKTVEINFDHENRLARYANGNEYPTVPGVQDVLSAFFFVRTLDLEVGKVYHVSAHSSRETYDLRVIVHRKETVEVAAGTYECFAVEPVLAGEGLFKHEGKMTLYITDDQYRVPVLIKTKVPVGSIDVELKEYRPGRVLDR